MYKNLGIGTTTILALSGVYGTIAFASNVVTTLFLTDAWGRRKYVHRRDVKRSIGYLPSYLGRLLTMRSE